MNILDRFSSHLKDILARSIQLAADLKNPSVEPIHLLFALSGQKGSMATEIMNRFKLNPKIVEQAILSLPTNPGDVLDLLPGSTSQQTLVPLSADAKAALEKAMGIAQAHDHSYIGTEHLLSSLIQMHDPLIDDVLKVNGIAVPDLEKQLKTMLTNATQFPRLTEVNEVVERMQENLNDIMPNDQSNHRHHETPKKGRKKDTALDFFATNLTSPESQKNIDPVIGRDKEVERVIHILARRTKNNPLLLGEPGVGKTAIVEGLAKRIVSGDVPDMLLRKKIYALDMGMLIAGTIYRGEFEGRLRQVIDEVTSNPDIILFIDEIHNIVGTGSNQGTMDAANILKPALARGLIRCIGATTPAEYKKYVESDPALERRFQPVPTKEPSLEDTIKILAGIKSNYEAFHNVTITSVAVEAAARLADRYITAKFLPDKAIDLLDETAAAKRVQAKSSPFENKLWRLTRELEKIIQAKEQAAANDKFSEAVAFKKSEEQIRAEIKKLQTAHTTKKIKTIGTVTERDVIAQVAKMIGTDPSELILDNVGQFKTLEEQISEHIVGQTETIGKVAQLVRQAQLGLSNPDRPLASFLFVGESGVGKTELAKTLAKILYRDKDAFIKLDMSEFNEAFGVSKLLGSPAGYVGFKEQNQFTDKIKLNPYCVILFDEIDKAHKDIIKLLLQMLENGEIADSSGKKISLKHAILILTTSLGAAEASKGALGFGRTTGTNEENLKHLTEKLKEHFSPEVINRLDQICFFEPLDTKKLVRIAELELNRLNERLQKYHATVSSTEAVLEWLVENLKDKKGGAREVRRYVRSEVEQLVAQLIMNNKLKSHYTLTQSGQKLALK